MTSLSNGSVHGTQATSVYLAAQFEALNHRLDKIEKQLDAIGYSIQILNGKVQHLQWSLEGMRQQTGQLQDALARSTYDILMEINEQKHHDCRAIATCGLSPTDELLVTCLEHYSNLAENALSRASTLDLGSGVDPFETLMRFVSNTFTTSAEENQPRPIAALCKVLAAYEGQFSALAGTPGTAAPRGVARWSPVDASQVLLAVTNYCEIYRWLLQIAPAQRSIRMPMLDKMLARQVTSLRRSMAALSGLVQYLAPPMPTSRNGQKAAQTPWVMDRLLTLLDQEADRVCVTWSQFEWRLARQFLIAFSEQPASEPNCTEDFRKTYTAGRPIPFENTLRVHNLDTGLVNEGAFTFYVPTNGWFGDAPPFFWRTLPSTDNDGEMPLTMGVRFSAPPTRVEEAYNQGIHIATYEFQAKFYGEPLPALKDTGWSLKIYYRWRYPGSNDWPWIMLAPSGIYDQRDVCRHWQYAMVQDNANEQMFDAGATPHNKVRDLLNSWSAALIKYLKDDPQAATSYQAAIAQDSTTLLKPLLSRIQDFRYQYIGHCIKEPEGPGNPNKALLAPLRAALEDFQKLTLTIRAVCAYGMPTAYVGNDLLHALYDGSSKKSDQIRLPGPWILDPVSLGGPDGWDHMLAIFKTEKALANDPSRTSFHPRFADENFDEPIPFEALLRNSVAMLKKLIEQMRDGSIQAGIPFQVARAQHVLQMNFPASKFPE